MEWDRRSCPFQNAINKSDNERGNSRIGYYNPEEEIQAQPPYSDEDKQNEYYNYEEGIEGIHSMPRFLYSLAILSMTLAGSSELPVAASP
jgi:hypothetical protein